MKDKKLVHLIELNIATVFLGTSGPLGKFVHLPPPFTICVRSAIAVVFLTVIMKLIKESFHIDLKNHWKFFLISGLLMSFHWVSYFYALQLSNVALAQIAIFTFPVITTLLEPLILKKKFSLFNFIAALLVFTGIVIMVPEFSFNNKGTLGVLVGVLSALVYAIRNIYNKKYIQLYSGVTLMYYQLIIVSLSLAPSIALLNNVSQVPIEEWYAVIALGVFTSAIGHTMFTKSFKNFDVSTASIINSLTPIYGVILAYFFLDEVPAVGTMIGGGLIIVTVLMENMRSYRKSKA